MKKILLLLLISCTWLTAQAEERVALGEGKAAVFTVPGAWAAASLPPGAAPAGAPTRHYVTKSGSNDSVLISFISVPDDRLDDRAALKETIEEASQQFVAGSVEGKVILKEFKIGGNRGFTCSFTDANLVGKPSEKDNFKAIASCYVYLGNHVLVTATIFTDDLNGKACGEALQIVRSIGLVLPGKAI